MTSFLSKAKDNYGGKIHNYYEDQKNKFLQQLNSAKKDSINQITGDILNSISSVDYGKSNQVVSATVKELIGRYYSQITSNGLVSKETIKSSIKGTADLRKQQGKKNFYKALEQYYQISNRQIDEIMWEHLNKIYSGLQGSGVDLLPLVNRLRGFVKQQLYSQTVKKQSVELQSLNSQIITAAGFLREGLYYEAISDYFNQYFNDVQVVQIGGKNTETDIKISFPVSGSINKSEMLDFSVQVKSFDPGRIASNSFKYAYTIKTNAVLANELTPDYWDSIVYKISDSLNLFKSAFGDHVFWATRSGLIWSCELIQQFKMHNYYLGLMPGKKLAWQTAGQAEFYIVN